jgi:kynureninase
VISREDALRLDEDDPLAAYRERFVISDPAIIYMNGNSLGRMPVAAAERVREVTSLEWGSRLAGSWPHWIELPSRIGDLIGVDILGARPGEVVVSDSTSVNLYKLASAALQLTAPRSVILTEAANFPSDLYVLDGVARAAGARVRRLAGDPPDAGSLAATLGADVALVCFSHVNYRSAGLADLAAMTTLARDAGALTLWDLSHSAGVVPVELEACGVDLAVGCTYKYLSGGPGSPAFLYARRGLQDRLLSPISGWFGHRDQFGFSSEFEPADGVGRFMVGTPPIVSLAAVECGARLVADAGIAAIRAKSVAITELMIGLFDQWLAPLGFALASPRDPARRGSHLAFRHPAAWPISRTLVERCGVVVDFREPDVVRFGIGPLYTRFVDAWDAMDRTRTAVADGMHLEFAAERSGVT